MSFEELCDQVCAFVGRSRKTTQGKIKKHFTKRYKLSPEEVEKAIRQLTTDARIGFGSVEENAFINSADEMVFVAKK